MNRGIAHVSAVELFAPTPDESAAFFADLMAMEVVVRAGDRTYLHAWDDYEAFTVKVTDPANAGIGRTWLRATSPKALRRRIQVIEEAGLAQGWNDDEPSYGPVFHFHRSRRSFDGAVLGANVRRLHHVNYLAADVARSSCTCERQAATASNWATHEPGSCSEPTTR
jgi:catechol 2,3-dioxygenase